MSRRRQDVGFVGVRQEPATSLRDAIIHTEARRAQLAAARRSSTVRDGRIGTAVLIGGAATTAAAVFRAPTDLIAGLGLSSGVLQATRSLYFQRGYDTSYLAAERALGCVARASRASLDAHLRAEDTRVGLAQERAVIASLETIDGINAAKALAAVETSNRSADAISGATASLARQAPVAADSILDVATQQLAKQMPDAQAYDAAIQSITSLQTAPSKTEVAADFKAGGPTGTSTEEASQADKDRLRIAIANVTVLAARMETARTDFETRSNDALKVCGFTPTGAPAAITFAGLQGNALTVKKGESISFVIEGGSGSYFTSVMGSRPAGVDISQLGGSVEIRVDAKTGKPGAFKLRVRDAVAKLSPADVAVTIQ
jgi:hypothetical protein